MYLNTIHSFSNTYCQNCGADSHCGNPRYVTEQDYEVDGGEYREIKVCDHCRCKQCTPETSAEPKTYNLKFKKINTEGFKKPKREVTWEQLLLHMQNLSRRRT